MSHSQRQFQKPLNVDWQATMYTTLDRTKHLLDTGILADCEFLVGGDDEKKELIKANRTILAMNSPVFEIQFFGTDVPQPQPILLPDMQPETFKKFLQFIYTERTELKSLDEAENLSYAASKYILPTLFRICVEYMGDNLSPENVFRALEFGIFHNETELKEKCFRMLSQQMRVSLARSSTDFESIDVSTLLSIVKMDVLDITEVELFEAAKLWAGRQCLTKCMGLTGINMRQELEKIISHIRFLAMTPEEFAISPACSGILTNEECLSVFMNLNSRVNFIMPAQLSLSRNQRRVVESDIRPSVRSKVKEDINHVSLLLSPSFLSSTEKIYCLRRITNEVLVHNQGNLDCSVTLSVDQKIRIQGIVISSQISERPDGPSSGRYTEIGLHYCHLLDPDGTRLTYRHFAGPCSRVRQPPTFDVFFNRPILMEKNRAYKICLLLNRNGSAYSLGTASTCNIFNGVRFQFGPPSVRDGIIRGVIFDLV